MGRANLEMRFATSVVVPIWEESSFSVGRLATRANAKFGIRNATNLTFAFRISHFEFLLIAVEHAAQSVTGVRAPATGDLFG